MANNVLIVDDSATLREIVMRGISQAGIDFADVEAAGDGVAGKQVVEADKFDLFLANVDMPDSNGLEFVEVVTQQPRTPDRDR